YYRRASQACQTRHHRGQSQDNSQSRITEEQRETTPTRTSPMSNRETTPTRASPPNNHGQNSHCPHHRKTLARQNTLCITDEQSPDTSTRASSMSNREATQMRASPRNNRETTHTARITVEERPF